MKKILFLLISIICLSHSTAVNAQKKSKKDKEKKEYVWDWNGERSGDKDAQRVRHSKP